jgi:hypothetical protein
MNYADDVDALADLGWGPEHLDKLASAGVEAGAFAQFRALDGGTRALVLRLLDSPSEADFRDLDPGCPGRRLGPRESVQLLT